MALKRALYAVTFENPEVRPPDTVRGVVVAGTLTAAISRAVRAAMKAKTTRGYTSVVVLLEWERAKTLTEAGS